MIWIDAHQALPATHLALGPDSEAPGLLAIGAPVTPERLEQAYTMGVFPWYSPGQPPLWWSPDPRMVLPVAEFRLSLTLRKTLRRFIRDPRCEIRFDSAFRAVMQACAEAPREGQNGTWIVPEIIDAYTAWHHAGRAHSVETWIDGELAGGLYGVGMGRMVFGESMFARRTDASKIALCALVAWCRAHGVSHIDCQQHTAHLASFGAREVPRTEFEAHLARTVTCTIDHPPTKMPQTHGQGATPAAVWTYHPSLWAQLIPDLLS